MKLFLVTTRGLGDYYVIAETFNDVQNVLEKILSKGKYGFTNDRKIENIRVITNKLIIGYDSTPNFNDDNRLIIKEYWDKIKS